MHTRLKYWAGDHMGFLDALAALLSRCKRKARQATARKPGLGAETPVDEAARAMWTERGARVCLIMASQLVEMKVRPGCLAFIVI